MNETHSFQRNVKQIQIQITNWLLNDSPRQFLWRKIIFSNESPIIVKDRVIDRHYAIFIAEFMLIRTKAEQVEPVYEKFLNTFPSFRHINQGNKKDVELFLGKLGLHRRVGQLLEISQRFENEALPETFEDLIKISGIGQYSAAAFSCFANNQRIPLVDTNFVRIYCRLFGIVEKSEMRRNKSFLDLCKKVLPYDHFQEFNLGILDLGALICTPVPECSLCPVSEFCKHYTFLELIDREISCINVPFFDQSGLKGILSRIEKLLDTKHELRVLYQTHFLNKQAQKRTSKNIKRLNKNFPNRFISDEITHNSHILTSGLLIQPENLYVYKILKMNSLEIGNWKLVTDNQFKQEWIMKFNGFFK